MKAWVNHFALNIGTAISSVWHALIPPQWTGHNDSDLNELRKTNPIAAFWEGLTK